MFAILSSMHPLHSYIKKNKKKHIIFDFDETLFQLQMIWSRVFEEIAPALQELDPELWQLRMNRGISYIDVQNEFVKKHGEAARVLFVDRNVHKERELYQGVVPNHELLAFFNKPPDVKYSIWSSNTRGVIAPVLKDYNIDTYFSHVVTRNDVSLLKPEPEGFSLINPLLQKRETYVLVGDSIFDENAAKAAGIDFYAIHYFH